MGAMGAMENATNKAEPPKRRACDECRAKKLACSKEVDGCARCKREGIKCVYSVQKQMGRPRKRAHDEVEPAAHPPPAPEAHHTPQHGSGDGAGKEQHTHILSPFDPAMTMELDMSFLDFDNQDMTFFDYLDSVPLPADPDFMQQPAAKKPNTTALEPAVNHVWLGGSFLGPIDFDDLNRPPPAPQMAQEVSREDIERIMTAEMPPEKLPSLSPPASHDTSSSSGMATTPSSDGAETEASPQPPAMPRCACLSSLYLALDSLQHLPNDVTAAMKIARTAARSAHDAVMCDACGNPPLDYARAPNIQSFQNLMMLGALLPSLANAYTRILGMIDAEATKADQERRQLLLKLDDYGGLWGSLAIGFNAMPERDKFWGKPLEPALWRLTIRSLLKLDVYGLHPAAGGADDLANLDCCMQQEYLGLKDIIAMVEERSRKRHQQLDMALASGLIEKPTTDCAYEIGQEDPPCMRIIDIAKRSMNDLVIP
ncbi:hypothetical protein QBC47DRAFT_202499 [Echria macrotheca]|uniref:Zn(2)-C6 fungal-type domain-containing protein n=1 Tax=Echria macrotheca TaxID=438768 RepID=A0AAJ0BDM5_9PEZI|nr:hypothetical protein QBC47DRAFT_202499 [Echria macrotheca]